MKTNATASEVARHLDVSPQRVGNMVKEGILKRSSSGLFDLDRCRIDYIRWLRASPRRNSQSASAARTAELKIQALEMRLARDEGQLINIVEIETVVEDILATYIAELGGVPAAATRDVELRRGLEEKYSEAMDRCRARFDQKFAALRRGEEAFEDDAEATT